MAQKKCKHHKSTIINSEKVKEIIRNNYEEGRQDRSKIAIYRNKIFPVFGIDERTFWRYMREIENEYKISEDKNQLKLFQ